jgi:hypothetical protein
MSSAHFIFLAIRFAHVTKLSRHYRATTSWIIKTRKVFPLKRNQKYILTIQPNPVLKKECQFRIEE